MTEQKRMVDQIAEVTGSRRNMNGKPLLNFLRVAIHWMDYLANLGKPVVLDPENVCYMMELFKMARQENTFQPDNILDGIGYLDCLDAIHRQMQEMGYPLGAEELRNMNKYGLECLRDKLVKAQQTALRLIVAADPAYPGRPQVYFYDDLSNPAMWTEEDRSQVYAGKYGEADRSDA